MAVEFGANFDKLARQIETLPDRAYRKLRPAFAQISMEFIVRHRKKRLTDRPGLIRRSGALARSFQYIVTGSNTQTLRTTIFTTSKYARIHEHGGIIKAKNHPYLTFRVQNVAGVALSSKGGSFVRVKQVTIPPRLNFVETWQSAENQAIVMRRLTAAMQSALNEVKNG